MSRYIDADKIKFHYMPLTALSDKLIAFKEEIRNIPAADVQEVVHAQIVWKNEEEAVEYVILTNRLPGGRFIGYSIEKKYTYPVARCSECGGLLGDTICYCPNCGAKMDEVTEK